jgi:hypothetical protein
MVMVGGLLLTTGCVSNFDLRESLTLGTADSIFYFDEDEDGWGDPNTEPQLLDQAEGLYTASNERDCDDSDPLVTARLGPACPADLVGDSTEFVSYRYVSEFVAVHSSTNLVLQTNAQTACGGSGWGGALAHFDEDIEFSGMQEALDAVLAAESNYAGFIGVMWDSTSEDWVWEQGEGLSLSGGDFCGDGAPTLLEAFPQCDTINDPCAEIWDDLIDSLRLALVRESGSWCVGLAEDAYTADGPAYESTRAHFICGRDAPEPSDYR